MSKHNNIKYVYKIIVLKYSTESTNNKFIGYVQFAKKKKQKKN